ncbi:hypothetical protein OIU79_013634 [Salix purpurea]|uniref:O-fucosyltransferase family protein n=1 Tax=Salix purpurea TaxID=77065 RepID=A0A9Q0SVW3_SALPP|nr:hypothetical protein OIU79_013634 [Salix purpurea]
MAKSKNNAKKVSCISVPSQKINSLSSSSLHYLFFSPKKPSANRFFGLKWYRSSRFWGLALFLCGFPGMLKLWYTPDPSVPFSPDPCVTSQSQLQESFSNRHTRQQLGLVSNDERNGKNDQEVGSVNARELKFEVGFGSNEVKNESLKGAVDFQGRISCGVEEDSEFWKQPDGLGFKPCLKFSGEYSKESELILEDRRKYLLVVVSGGMNQQRNQIVDAVVIARILGAALVVPILQVNVIWGDESEFSDIFDLENFKRVLANDVRIVSSLPSNHVTRRPVVESRTPLHVSPHWIRARYLKRLNREGVLLLRGLDSRLSKDLPSDLQKLRCKVAFHALRFVPPVVELGNKLAERMQRKGPYIALHLRMELDVWVRTGCHPGLNHEYDEIINQERRQRPELLTAKSNMTCHERKLAGLCPLSPLEVARLLKALGAPKSARIYWAGGQPLGGKEALLPLTREFPHFYNKEDLASAGELKPFANKASLMAAIDYLVSEKSDVFMPSHGGNMGHAIQGHRAYAGHKKYITPNKRHMLRYFLNSSLPEAEFNGVMKELHRDSLGQPELRTSKAGRDVTKYPVPECMCRDEHDDRSHE